MSRECPHEDGPFHFWEADGSPFGVECDNCGAEGRIVLVSEETEFNPYDAAQEAIRKGTPW